MYIDLMRHTFWASVVAVTLLGMGGFLPCFKDVRNSTLFGQRRHSSDAWRHVERVVSPSLHFTRSRAILPEVAQQVEHICDRDDPIVVQV